MSNERRAIAATLAVLALTATACGAGVTTVRSTTPLAVQAKPEADPQSGHFADEAEACQLALEAVEGSGAVEKIEPCQGQPALIKRAAVVEQRQYARLRRSMAAHSKEDAATEKREYEEGLQARARARSKMPDAALFERVEREDAARRHKTEAEYPGVSGGPATEGELIGACEEAARSAGSWTIDTEVGCAGPAQAWIEGR